MALVTPTIGLIIFVLIIVVSIIVAWYMSTYSDYDKSSFHTFVAIISGFSIFITFMFYWNLLQLQAQQQQLVAVQELARINDNLLNSVLDSITHASTIIPNFVLSLTPLTNTACCVTETQTNENNITNTNENNITNTDENNITNTDENVTNKNNITNEISATTENNTTNANENKVANVPNDETPTNNATNNTCAIFVTLDPVNPQTCTEKMSLSYRIFAVWQDFISSNSFIHYDANSYIAGFLQRANSPQLYAQWSVVYVDFNNNTQALGNLLFEYGLPITVQTPQMYEQTANSLISDSRYQSIMC